MMPEMDGMEAVENIRKIPELANVIITFYGP
jgi:two-component system alkaline phosphatase synthesis response regulator PhoP